MNSVHEQCPNSDCNSALNQNWVGCTVRTPKTQVARSAQVMGAATCTSSRSCAHARLVACAAAPAPVATQSPGHDTLFQQAMSRPQIDVATSLCSFHRNAPVATQNLGCDTKPPQGSQNHVATSNRCRDTTQATPGRDLKTGSRHRFSCPAPSQVATPKPGRDPPGD